MDAMVFRVLWDPGATWGFPGPRARVGRLVLRVLPVRVGRRAPRALGALAQLVRPGLPALVVCRDRRARLAKQEFLCVAPRDPQARLGLAVFLAHQELQVPPAPPAFPVCRVAWAMSMAKANSFRSHVYLLTRFLA